MTSWHMTIFFNDLNLDKVISFLLPMSWIFTGVYSEISILLIIVLCYHYDIYIVIIILGNCKLVKFPLK